MRKRQSFMLTVLTSDSDVSLCGQIKMISSGKIITFTNLEELNTILASEMDTVPTLERPCPSTETLLSTFPGENQDLPL
jgi:hypothetical protein